MRRAQRAHNHLYPIVIAMLYRGGTLNSMWMWSGIAVPSTSSISFWRHAEAGATQEREPPRFESGVLVAQGPDADAGQLLAEPSRPMEAAGSPVIPGVSVEAVDEDDVPASSRVVAAVDP
jgi:hypothetical protein